MTKIGIELMNKSELLTRFMDSRDNLIHFRVASLQNPKDKTILELLELEREEYIRLKNEIYRRMKF